MSKGATRQIREEDIRAINGFWPFATESPNGTPMLGLTIDSVPLTGVKDESDIDEANYIFIAKSWPIRMGFQLIRFGISTAIKQILHGRKK